MQPITITLELPPKELHPNSRVHWRPKNKVKKDYQEGIGYDIRNQCSKSPRWESATIQATFYRKTNHKSDPDNLNAWIKYAIDGLVHAKILADDDKVTLLPPIEVVDKDNPRLELVIHGEDCFYGIMPSGDGWVIRNSDGEVTHSIPVKEFKRFLERNKVQ